MADSLNRREFTRLCSSMIAGAFAGAQLPLRAEDKVHYPRAQLLDNNKQPITAATLDAGEPYLFFYPFVTTPCFLINLGTSAAASALTDSGGKQYDWRGGVGPDRSVVAYSAICSHKMSHPAKEISFINYRHDTVSFYNREGKNEERTGVISCCSERSIYDPRDGARVLSGPAPQPLAAIELQTEESTGHLFATASYGGEMYERFFDKFGFRASMEHRVTDPKKPVGKSSTIRKLADYSGQTIKC